MKYTYLLIDFFTILVPFGFSFHPAIPFYKKWPAFFPAVLLTGLLFVLWDSWFTKLGVWGFNPQYLTGVMFGNLPLEEVLFFFCIPYSCVFSYYCIARLSASKITGAKGDWFSPVLLLLAVAAAIIYHNRFYTCYAFALLAILLLLSKYVFKAGWLSTFYKVYALLLIPFIIVNGLLTGTGLQSPVVWYSPLQFSGFRILTIPVEDIFYGMDLILLNLLLFTFFNRCFYKHIKLRRSKIKYKSALIKSHA
jgi:lycopene cyclase domain-containing protein